MSSSSHPVPALVDSPIVRALAGDRPEHPPVWFQRQAGRSLPEYRASRAGVAMLDACLDPALAAEITLQPVRRHRVDAAVFFSDIVVPLKLAGIDVEIVPGRGPVFASPVRTVADIDALPELDPEALAPIREAVRLTVAELAATGTPLLGFAGAPFTLAAYLVEGGPSKEHMAARALMHADPGAWRALMAWAARITGTFLVAQLEAGAAAGQLFDSWAGSLSADDYATHVAPASAAALAPARATGAPLLHFAVGSGELLPEIGRLGTQGIGIDWRLPLDTAFARIGRADVTLQGNIDPALLFAPWEVLEAHVRDVVDRGRVAPAHIVNLGHGVPPETDPDVLTRIVELVHTL